MMAKFLATTLEVTDEFGIVLSMFILVAAGARAPEVMLVLVGHGEMGNPSFLPCTVG